MKGLVTRTAGRGVSWALALTMPLVAAAGAAEPVPHGQSRTPGAPLSPAEAARKMSVPDGFHVEVVASEPDIVNPVAMTFDERGRIWITESLEYPRREPGVGRDRVKVLEDRDGDGKADAFTVFADGLNIPSGIAVGHGGVWVANSPDLLFLQDRDGDGKADHREVVVTGFGRSDTHELPNSLTWGPDGWLYGWNGVFNPSHIVHRGKTFNFTCAIFRIHPKTREFELFCEGTSNPWGIAWDNDGGAFASACVIDHLWHLVEGGYYHRQGGPYPPFTWKIESIVDHRHQQAAYCGIHYFDSDAYPARFRDRLYFGNIHGNAINVDTVERNGSSYRAKEAPDFLTANDPWFMPVAQKTGPDGCLYILDWYDRYHCYQDANRDPKGIDRLKGRLYRVRYKEAPRPPRIDLAKESDADLLRRLDSPNVYHRDLAQRLLVERASPRLGDDLRALILEGRPSRKGRMHALWALVGSGPLEPRFHLRLLADPDAGFRAWGVRAAGNAHRVGPEVRERIVALAADPSPDVRLQVAIAARKVEGIDPLPLLVAVLTRGPSDDPVIPRVVWRNLQPLLETEGAEFARLVAAAEASRSPAVFNLLPRAIDRLLVRRPFDPGPVIGLVSLLAERREAAGDPLFRDALGTLAARARDGEIKGRDLDQLRDGLRPRLDAILKGPPDASLYHEAALLATTYRDPIGMDVARRLFRSTKGTPKLRLNALEGLIAAGDDRVLDDVGAALADHRSLPLEFRGQVLDALGKCDDPRVADLVLGHYRDLEPPLRPRAIELLTQRVAWSRSLLEAIGRGVVDRSALNLNQVRKILGSNDRYLAALVKLHWGNIREGRNPEREQVITRMKTWLRTQKGDPHAGQAVFRTLCGQCHKIYGEGHEVGPEITLNGRASFDQLLSNIFDPSLVIGPAYQATTVATTDGRILTGLLAEENPMRIVLKTQGGKLEVIPRAEVEESKLGTLSLMPENLESQLKPKELADLFAFLTLDRPPSDPKARPIPGAGLVAARESTDPAQFGSILADFAPGFSTKAVGEGGLALLEEYRGKSGVLRTHPIDEERPCILRGEFAIPAGHSSRLLLDVSHHPQGDWQLVVKADGQVLRKMTIGPRAAQGGWADVAIDLSRFAGRKVAIELENRANGWSYEFGYWGRIAIVSEPSRGVETPPSR